MAMALSLIFLSSPFPINLSCFVHYLKLIAKHNLCSMMGFLIMGVIGKSCSTESFVIKNNQYRGVNYIAIRLEINIRFPLKPWLFNLLQKIARTIEDYVQSKGIKVKGAILA